MLRSGAIEAPPATMQSAAMLRSGAIEAPPATMQSAAMLRSGANRGGQVGEKGRESL